MSATQPIRLEPAGYAISGHPRSVSVQVRRHDWPWHDDYAPLDAPGNLPQGSHDAFDGSPLGGVLIGFTVPRGGTYP